MGDIAEETLPAIFDGVDVPKGTVDSFDVVGTRADGERSIGETVYHTPRGSIGLRSTWSRRGNTWKAVALENFPAAEGA